MSNLISTFQERFGDWLTALGQHLQLSLLTLIIAIQIHFVEILAFSQAFKWQ